MCFADGVEELRPYVAFHAALRASYQHFVSELETKVNYRIHYKRKDPSMQRTIEVQMRRCAPSNSSLSPSWRQKGDQMHATVHPEL